ncbi:MAG: hypothetical protein CR967_06065 [Proteobacteria bacterium]|nr:MAG: hypothetical protein CR967_06065 [Pseudomonadota bacterium]
MGFKKFVNDVVDFLDLDSFSVKGKKKSVKNLTEKLENRRKKVKKELRRASTKKEKKRLGESLELINGQIKKGRKYLNKLESKS